ncbi:MFS transporter [Azospirillum endophyticum]
MSAVDAGLARSTSDYDRLYRKLFWRLLPLLFGCYIVAYLDRVNVGFAKLQMLNELQFSEAVYGAGAGIFFIGYFLFEVPSNLILHRVGARRWIARIMISWGVVSAATMFVTSVPTFYALRFLLGACEAGFYPGVILYLTSWFPAARRGAILAGFITAVPVAGLLGGPLSGAILTGFDGVSGLAGWKWLFLIEAVPSIIAGVCVLLFLDDNAETARWLTPAEKRTLAEVTRTDAPSGAAHRIRAGFADARLWMLSLIYFGIVMGSYGIGFWLPSLIATLGVRDPLEIGLWSAIPNGAGIVGMIAFARSSDRRRERPLHVAVACLLGMAGLVGSVLTGTNIPLAMAFLTLATFGIYAALPVFWTMPPLFLAGAASAAGIATINSIGNLAGFVSPSVVGWIKQTTGSADLALYLIGACLTAAALALVLIRARLIAPTRP